MWAFEGKNVLFLEFFSDNILIFCEILQVVDIMKTNVEKVLERDQKLSELDDRAGNFWKKLHYYK